MGKLTRLRSTICWAAEWCEKIDEVQRVYTAGD